MNCWPCRPASAQSVHRFLSGAPTKTGLRPLFTISISDSCRKLHGVSAASSVWPICPPGRRNRRCRRTGSNASLTGRNSMMLNGNWPRFSNRMAMAQQKSVEPSGLTLLYVGGRAHQIPQLKAMTERAGGRFLHHDGGIEHGSGLIPGLINRADRVLFPIDCISHDAVATIKRHCRLTGKVYEPLRTASLACLLSALVRMTGCRKTIAAE